MDEKKKILIFIPTYNEAENVEVIYSQIKAQNLAADVLFLDDNSPDGTGQVIDCMATEHQNVFAIHRSGKLGIGSAHKTGIKWAYEKGYQLLVTMDCDLTHSPDDIGRFIRHAKDADVVIGSRYLKEKSLKDWNLFRKFMTHLGHFLTKNLLSLPYDASGAFRLYRLDRIPSFLFEFVYSASYSFFFESLFILNLNACSIKELPIDLPSRTYGHSKMSYRDACYSLLLLVYLCIKKTLERETLIWNGASYPEHSSSHSTSAEEWDIYWKPKQTPSGLLYDLAATLYRKLFIKKALRCFLTKYFNSQHKILHAGCGSGQVDVGCHNRLNIFPLDISDMALARYRQINPGSSCYTCGNIFQLSMADETFDGVYNLGVMEHFSEDEIHEIIAEFYRVLKPDGKLVLFWPPRFGLSVIFLKFVHYVSNNYLKKDLKLHPDEITHYKSKEHMKKILDRNGFKWLENYFGLRDFFTHVVVVAQKKSLKSHLKEPT